MSKRRLNSIITHHLRDQSRREAAEALRRKEIILDWLAEMLIEEAKSRDPIDGLCNWIIRRAFDVVTLNGDPGEFVRALDNRFAKMSEPLGDEAQKMLRRSFPEHVVDHVNH